MAMVNSGGMGFHQVGYYPYQNPNNYYIHQHVQTVPTAVNEYECLLEQQQQQQQQQQFLLQQQQQQLHLQQYQQQQTFQNNTAAYLQQIHQQQLLQQQQQQIQNNSNNIIPTSPTNHNTTPNLISSSNNNVNNFNNNNNTSTLQTNKKRNLESPPTPTYGFSNIYSQNPSYFQNFNFVPISQPVSPPQPNEIMDEDIEEQLREYLLPIFSQHLDPYAREHLQTLLTDYLNDEIPLKNLLAEMREVNLDDRTLLHYLIEVFMVMDTTNKMYNFLKENGVDDQELNIDTKNFAMLFDVENGFKKRERSRKSVSRGLRNPPNKWTKEESQRLIQLVHENGDKQWKKIALQIGGGKTGAQCAQHWKRVLCPAIRKGSWDEEEEAKLFILVDKHGQSWKNVASEIRTRTDIQCRYQYFKSCMSREVPWSQKEDELLQKKVIECKQEGREVSWMDLSKSMARARQTKIPRTALECKARWEAISMGSIVDGMDFYI
eukprot:gene7434-9136_t